MNCLKQLEQVTKETFDTSLLKKVRKTLNLSQETFAKELDVSFASLNGWETGKRKPSYKGIKALNEFGKRNRKQEEKNIVTIPNQLLKAIKEISEKENISIEEVIDHSVAIYTRLIKDNVIQLLHNKATILNRSVPGLVSEYVTKACFDSLNKEKTSHNPTL